MTDKELKDLKQYVFAMYIGAKCVYAWWRIWPNHNIFRIIKFA